MSREVIVNGEKTNQYICQCCGDIVSSLRAYGDWLEVCSECEELLDNDKDDCNVKEWNGSYLVEFEHGNAVEFTDEEWACAFQREWRADRNMNPITGEELKKLTIDVVFRYDKKFNYVQMFYWDEHKQLVCFCMEEGHGEASYEYYLSTQHLNGEITEEQEQKIQKIVNFYNDDETEIRVMKRLQRGVCSYA